MYRKETPPWLVPDLRHGHVRVVQKVIDNAIRDMSGVPPAGLCSELATLGPVHRQVVEDLYHNNDLRGDERRQYKALAAGVCSACVLVDTCPDVVRRRPRIPID